MVSKCLVILLIITMIVGCQNNTSDETSSNTQLNDNEATNQESSTIKDETHPTHTILDFSTYHLSDSFLEIVRNNPIDKDFTKESDDIESTKGFTTNGMIQFEAKYADIWDKELNNIYNKLLKKLDKNQKELLIKSQRGWLEYHLKETDFVEQTFEDGSSNDIGSQGLINMETEIKNRLRDRTIELMEYYYMLGEETNYFIYRNNKE